MQPARSAWEDALGPQQGAFPTLSYGEMKPLGLGVALLQSPEHGLRRALSGGGVPAPCWIPLTVHIFPAIQGLKMCVLNYNQAS